MLHLLAAAVLCTITDPRIPESSGLSVARGRLYTANDSGDSARFFALDRRCTVRAVVELPGVDAVDVEDLARTPDGALWLADIGDNRARRSAVALYRWRDGAVTTYRLSYPDGAHDAEALVISRGRAYVVTKSLTGRAGVYAADPRPGAVARLRRVASVDLGFGEQVTGAALSPDGSRVALRTYTAAYEWPVPGGDVAAALRGRPVRTPLPETRQGEAMAYDDTGRTLVTSTEGLPGDVHEVPAARLSPARGSGTRSPWASATPPRPGGTAAGAPSDRAGSGRRAVALGALGGGLLVGAIAALVRRSRRRRRVRAG